MRKKLFILESMFVGLMFGLFYLLGVAMAAGLLLLLVIAAVQFIGAWAGVAVLVIVLAIAVYQAVDYYFSYKDTV